MERTRPIRDWQGLLHPPPPSAEGESPTSGACPSGTTDADSVSEGVRVAYQVAEEKLREGRRRAQEHNNQRYGASNVSRDPRDAAMRFWTDAAEMTRCWMTMWMDTVQSVTAPWMQAGGPVTEMFRSCSTRESHVGFHVAVKGGEAAVSLTVEPGVDGARLCTPGLQRADGKGKTIREVKFEAGEGAEIARVTVQLDGHAAGTYSGAILDEKTDRAVGGMTVTVSG